MIYLLALIGLVTVAVLLWKAFGPDSEATGGRVMGPDDDPEFLWQVDRQNHRRTGGTQDGAPGDPQD
ncbi:hypothetical protein ACFYVR_12055 [Rhodococcus sp. NPDC003318]|uniref:hypothetical protein n=1 Tax=Rhodococcus sp. NPDC003318 TaxID=3364503 RepID=UPI0036CE9FE1